MEGGVQLMGSEGGNLEDFKAEEENGEGGGGTSLQREVGQIEPRKGFRISKQGLRRQLLAGHKPAFSGLASGFPE